MPFRVVTIASETGAGGEAVGRAVAENLGFRSINEEIISLAAEKEGVDATLVADTERRGRLLDRVVSRLAEGSARVGVATGELLSYDRFTPARSEALRMLIVEAIRETADQGQVVIGSHAAGIPLAGRTWVLRVLITASLEKRVNRVAQAGDQGSSDAARFVRDNDAGRAAYFRRFYQMEESPTLYDLVVNTDQLSTDEAASMVVAAARIRA
jgi:cytidylate kinase